MHEEDSVEDAEFGIWLTNGIERGWVTEPYCNTHDGGYQYMGEDEMQEWEDGGDHRVSCSHTLNAVRPVRHVAWRQRLMTLRQESQHERRGEARRAGDDPGESAAALWRCRSRSDACRQRGDDRPAEVRRAGGQVVSRRPERLRDATELIEVACHRVGVVAGEQPIHRRAFRGGAFAERVGRK